MAPSATSWKGVGEQTGAGKVKQRLNKELARPALVVSHEAPHWVTTGTYKACLPAEIPILTSALVLPALSDLLDLPSNKHVQTDKSYSVMQNYFAATGYRAFDYYYL